MLLLLAVSVVGLSLFTGCGTPGSLPNTVTVTITGTDSNGLATVNSYLTLTQMQSQ
jgi:ABC-type transporter Mla subunit MlaD